MTHSDVVPALDLLGSLISRYQIADLDDFLESCRVFARDQVLNVAVFGRFKAGKSSFLNHLIGHPLLPVGVIPVTSVITEIEYGPIERAEARFLDGHSQSITVSQAGEFISEETNPGNSRQATLVHIDLPDLERYRGVRFVDTPDLESVLEHNTNASLDWLPNVGLALVAVAVDPPLSRHDIELIRTLSRYTPNISLLLTKVDSIAPGELHQVENFVHQQLARQWNGPLPVYPYSIRPGFEVLRDRLDECLARIRAKPGEQRSAILLHKTDSLVAECRDYLNVALRAAQSADHQRRQIQTEILGRKESLDDARLALSLIARNAAAGIRTTFEHLLQPHEEPVKQRLLSEMEREFPCWSRTLRMAMDRCDEWLTAALTREMSDLSTGVAPIL